MYCFSQAHIFMIFLIIGLLIGILFDIFRALRIAFKTSDLVTCIEDVIFMALTRFFSNSYFTFGQSWSNTFLYYTSHFIWYILLFFNG